MVRHDAELSALIELIYDAAIDEQIWPKVLNQLADAVGAHNSSLAIYDAGKGAFSGISPRTSPEYQQSYAKYWARRNDLWKRSPAMPVGQLFSLETLIPRDEFTRTAFYNEWCRPQAKDHILGTNVLLEGTTSAVASVHRSREQGDFGEQGIETFALLIPHLRRAVQMTLQLSDLELAKATSLEVLNRLRQGVLLVDSAARLLFVNHAGETFLADGEGLRIGPFGIHTDVPSVTDALHKLIAESAGEPVDKAGGGISVPRNARGALELLVVPFRTQASPLRLAPPAAIIFINDPVSERQLRKERLQQRFGLTAAEAAFALQIIKGDGRRAAAERLGISVSTARSHLTRVFEKTGVRRQAELTRLVLQLADE